jgi:hypothetical protein
MGVLLDLDEGSLQFFKNGTQYGPGYPPGSVSSPVVPAVQTTGQGHSLRLRPGTCPDVGAGAAKSVL